MPFLNFNGTICPEDALLIAAGNPAFRRGEGLIETMRWHRDAVPLLRLHLQRLNRSLPFLGLGGFALEQLEEEIMKTAVACGRPQAAMIRAQFFPGPAPAPLQFLIECRTADGPPPQGLSLGIATQVQKNPDALSALKTTSRLAYSFARREAALRNLDDVLLTNFHGRVVESTVCNVFAIRNGHIYTPPLSEGCIAGVMRAYLLEQVQLGGMPFTEKPLEAGEVLEADEVFLSNALRGVLPVRKLNSRVYASALTLQIAEAICLW